MSGDIRYQFFISSTYVDLGSERKIISDYILSLEHIPAGMELFTADNEEQWDTIQRVILLSDFYILVIGGRYGSIDKETGLSYTEREYDFAIDNGIPVLCFLPGDNYRMPSVMVESSEAQELLSKFKKKITDVRMISSWNDSSELLYKVSASISKSIIKYDRPGWRRGDSTNEEVKDKLIKYMEEIRELKEQVEIYKKASDKTVDLAIRLSNEKVELYLSPNNSDVIIIKLDELSYESFERNITPPKSIEIGSVKEELRHYLKQEEVDDFNRSIPKCEQAIDNYYDNLSKFNLRNEFSDFQVSIINSGTVKASNVTVKVDFSDIFSLFDDDDEMVSPSKPFIPDLIAKAQREFEKDEREKQKSEMQKHLDSLASMSSMGFGNNYSKGMLASGVTPLMTNIPSIHNPDNLAYLNDSKDGIIIHTNTARQDSERKIGSSFTILPKGRGNGNIHVSMLCDEYPSWVNFDIPILIE